MALLSKFTPKLVTTKSKNRNEFIKRRKDQAKKERKKKEEEESRRGKLEAIIEVAGAVCHDLNQPLQVLSGQIEIMEATSPEGSREQKRAVKMLKQIDHMARITRELNNITNYETTEYLEGQKIVDLEKASAQRSEAPEINISLCSGIDNQSTKKQE